VAAVILDPDDLPDGLDDSKALSAKRREELNREILARAPAVAFAFAPAGEIDEHNIRRATLRAMARAVAALAIRPDFVLIDGRDIRQGRARRLDGANGRIFSRLRLRRACRIRHARASRRAPEARSDPVAQVLLQVREPGDRVIQRLRKTSLEFVDFVDNFSIAEACENETASHLAS
jgi:hypothetical protein